MWNLAPRRPDSPTYTRPADFERRGNAPMRMIVDAAIVIAARNLPRAARLLADHHVPETVASRVLLGKAVA